MWYVYASTGISLQNLNRKLKDVIRQEPFFIWMFDQYDVPLSRLSDLEFEIKDLDGLHAQSQKNLITLDCHLFDSGKLLGDNLHFIVHEMTHWLTRQREKTFYFTDPEEIDAFVMAMGFEIAKGNNNLYEVFFPIIDDHFKESADAERLFKALLSKATLKAKLFKNKP